VVAHPGHELRVFGWMESARPRVCVITDGSGSGGEARLESTTGVLARTAARPGPIYGRMSDRAIYAAILDHDHGLFTALADELARALEEDGADCVVGDAVEGYNPSHDVCRLVINAAARTAERGRGMRIPVYDFALVGAPHECPEAVRHQAVWVTLDEQALGRKLEAARSYPELAGEVEQALARFGTAPFCTECLRPVDTADPYGGWDPARVPEYERFGEARVAAGVYRTVLRFGEHVRPLADALWEHGERAG
jgi:hypothetical protein